MTREEAIKIIYQEIHDTKIQGEKYAFLKKSCDEECEALDMAIKAFNDKDVLDKIRAEIERHRRKTQGIDPYDLVGDCLDIIDKYKAESEVQG